MQQNKNILIVMMAIGCCALVSQIVSAQEGTYEDKEVCDFTTSTEKCESCCEKVKKDSFYYFGKSLSSTEEECVCILPVGNKRLHHVCPFGLDRDGCKGCCRGQGLARSHLSLDGESCVCKADKLINIPPAKLLI